MVLLKRLYSETGLFDKVEFHKGINVIQGVYTKSEEEKRELNGIGKSTLIRLIDFALLSDTARTRYFDVNRHKFLKEHSVTLEFEAEGKTYFIKREFDEPRKSRFGTSHSSLETYEETELRRILGNLFFGKTAYDGYFESGWFRDLIKFFIKDDINHFDRKDPMNFVSQHARQFEIYAYNFFLLDLPNKSVVVFDDLKTEVDDLRKQKKKVILRLKEETGKAVEEINSEIMQLDGKIRSFEKSINEYKFSESYKDVENEIVKLSGEISVLLKKQAFLQRKLDEYKKSYEYEIEVDENKIVKLYSEAGKIFGDIIKKNLDDVVSFRKKLAENREKFLKKKETEINEEIDDLRSKLSGIEEKRSVLYKILDEKKALDSIKNTYSLLIEEKAKKERLLTSISQVNQLDTEIIKKNSEITKSISDISADTRAIQERINRISSLFFEIVRETIHVGDIKDAVFDIRANPNMKSPLKITIDVPKSEALGKVRFKILAYDVTLFLYTVGGKRELPHFLIHDGVFHGIDIKTTVRILNFINSKYIQSPNFQYIITANENEISIPDDKKDIYGSYNFDISQSIIATYKDIPSEMIFKREY